MPGPRSPSQTRGYEGMATTVYVFSQQLFILHGWLFFWSLSIVGFNENSTTEHHQAKAGNIIDSEKIIQLMNQFHSPSKWTNMHVRLIGDPKLPLV